MRWDLDGTRAGMRSIGVGVATADLVVTSLAELERDAFERLLKPS